MIIRKDQSTHRTDKSSLHSNRPKRGHSVSFNLPNSEDEGTASVSASDF